MNDKIDSILKAFMLLSICFVGGLCYSVARSTTRLDLQKEAVKVGVAHWVITTNEDGSALTKFEWITPLEKKEK